MDKISLRGFAQSGLLQRSVYSRNATFPDSARKESLTPEIAAKLEKADPPVPSLYAWAQKDGRLSQREVDIIASSKAGGKGAEPVQSAQSPSREEEEVAAEREAGRILNSRV